MVRAFWAVLIELWQFVFPPHKEVKTEAEPSVFSGPSAAKVVTLSPVLSSPKNFSGETAFVTKDKTYCYLRPLIAFDTIVGVLEYGQSVQVLSLEGQFARISTNDFLGWVDTQSLTYNKTEISPELFSLQTYHPDDIETVKIRRRLGDVCSGGVLFLPLQPTEFMLYRLLVRGIRVAWPLTRPRHPGTWQNILKGQPQVHIGIEPKTSSVMEYFKDDRVGGLAFVMAVHPDESIVIESVGKDKEGEYKVETLAETQWRELRPVFISFK